MTKLLRLGAVVNLLFASTIFAQVDPDSKLFKEVKALDSVFFERGFNQCDMAYLEEVMSKDLRFYHDQSGFQNYNEFFENTRKYICADLSRKPIRKLDPESLRVFPLSNNGALYGAIQSGTHHFYIREPGKADVWTSTAKFTNIWLLNEEKWILTEVLSYDHHDPKVESMTKDVLDELLHQTNVPAMGLGIINNGELTRIEVHGTLDGQRTAPYNSIFKVASLTKPVFAITILKLIDRGYLELDEPLYTYWIDEDIRKDKRHKLLTPRLVLTHQTGFPNWRYLTSDNLLSFEFDPGTKYQYSGEGFEYLRKAVENKLGKSIEEMALEVLFQPLEMRNTRFWWDQSIDESLYAQNFDADGNKLPTEKYYEANASANLLTTVEDYGKFLVHVIKGAGLSDELFNEMLTPQVSLQENDFFGLGWEILTGFSHDEYALLHSGKDPGVSTLAVLFPETKNGYLLFLNGDDANTIYKELLMKHLYLGEELWDRR